MVGNGEYVCECAYLGLVRLRRLLLDRGHQRRERLRLTRDDHPVPSVDKRHHDLRLQALVGTGDCSHAISQTSSRKPCRGGDCVLLTEGLELRWLEPANGQHRRRASDLNVQDGLAASALPEEVGNLRDGNAETQLAPRPGIVRRKRHRRGASVLLELNNAVGGKRRKRMQERPHHLDSVGVELLRRGGAREHNGAHDTLRGTRVARASVTSPSANQVVAGHFAAAAAVPP